MPGAGWPCRDAPWGASGGGRAQAAAPAKPGSAESDTWTEPRQHADQDKERPERLLAYAEALRRHPTQLGPALSGVAATVAALPQADLPPCDPLSSRRPLTPGDAAQ
jgi:hypothetical protein